MIHSEVFKDCPRNSATTPRGSAHKIRKLNKRTSLVILFCCAGKHFVNEDSAPLGYSMIAWLSTEAKIGGAIPNIGIK